MRRLSCALTVLCAVATTTAAVGATPATPSSKDRCAVCGMFVAPHQAFLAEMIFRDGEVLFFDGPRDLFKHYLGLAEKSPEKLQNLESVYVTEYYAVEMIDARSAFYVAGSDVFGPMGPELIPFRSEADAREFRKDHKGKAVLRFDAVDREALRAEW